MMSLEGTILRFFTVDIILFGDNSNDIERRNSRFFAISSWGRQLCPACTHKWPACNCVQSMCDTSGAYVQHVACHIAQLSNDEVEIAFIFNFISLARTDGWEETKVPGGKKPSRQASENATY